MRSSRAQPNPSSAPVPAPARAPAPDPFARVQPGARSTPLATRSFRTGGERLPVIGLGSWITFNVGNDPAARDALRRGDAAFFEAGGRMIDSSPMYGSSQSVIGEGCTVSAGRATCSRPTRSGPRPGARGRRRSRQSRRLWNIARFDLLQVHNLLAWEEHLPMLFAMKARRPAALRRHDHLGGPAPPRDGAIMRAPAARLRAGHLQPASIAKSSSASCRWRASAASRSSRTGRSAKAGCCDVLQRHPLPAGPPRSTAPAGRRSRSSSSSRIRR